MGSGLPHVDLVRYRPEIPRALIAAILLFAATARAEAPACSESINSIRIDELDKRTSLLFDEKQRALEVALASQKDRVETALASNDKRLDGMNEFRLALGDQARRAVFRDEYDSTIEGFREAIKALELSRAEIGGKASAETANGALLLAVLSLVATIAVGALTLRRKG